MAGNRGEIHEPRRNPSNAKKVDVNRASLREICGSLGVSVEVGRRIVNLRPYRRLDDLVSKRALGKKEFAKVREFIMVGSAP